MLIRGVRASVHVCAEVDVSVFYRAKREARGRGKQLAAALRPLCMHQRHISAETAGVVATRTHFQPPGRGREVSGRGAAAGQAK